MINPAINSELKELQQGLASLQGRFNTLEQRLAKHWPGLDEAYIQREARRLFWRTLWQGLDWLLWVALGGGIGLAMAQALLKG